MLTTFMRSWRASLLKRKTARTTEEEITFFKSVGIAAQDAFAAAAVYRNAKTRDFGQEIDW